VQNVGEYIKESVGTKAPVFERPPLAKEVFSKENKDRFDKLGDKEKLLVKTLILTGNIDIASAKAQMKELAELPEEHIQHTLKRYNMGMDKLMGYLHSCLEASEIRYTAKGDRYEYINLNLRKSTLELLFKLHGMFGEKQNKKLPKTLDLFPNLNV